MGGFQIHSTWLTKREIKLKNELRCTHTNYINTSVVKTMFYINRIKRYQDSQTHTHAHVSAQREMNPGIFIYLCISGLLSMLLTMK